MSNDPKLFTNKPKKGQLKPKTKGFPSPAPNPSIKMESSQSTPPPTPPKESFARRYKFLWPILLTVNLAVGAYLFVRTKNKGTDSEVAKEVPAAAAVASTTVVLPEKTLPTPTITEPEKTREAIPEKEQHELFKWMLEEKRKIKPADASEKKRIDEEKAILKQFIRAKSIPCI